MQTEQLHDIVHVLAYYCNMYIYVYVYKYMYIR